MDDTMCRVCLATNVRMCCIQNTPLQAIFERITLFKLERDSRSLQVCYICLTRLRHSHRLMVMCHQSEEMLLNIVDNQACLSNVKPSHSAPLSLSPIQQDNINSTETLWNYDSVKKEVDEESEEIKMEVEQHACEDLGPGSLSLKEELSPVQHHAEEVIEDDVPELLTIRRIDSSPVCDVDTRHSLHTRATRKSSEQQKENDETTTNTCDTENKPYRCHTCNKSFRHKKTIYAHNRIHFGESPYKCEICQYSCPVPSAYKVHIRKHTGEKPYQCHICMNSFSRKSSLIQHIHVHSTDKPYTCDQCHRSYNTKFNLNKHLRKHTERFTCVECPCEFTQKSSLHRHMRFHTEPGSNKCDVCQTAFSCKSALMRHIRNHTGEKPFKCDLCEHRFVTKSNLGRHIRTHK